MRPELQELHDLFRAYCKACDEAKIPADTDAAYHTLARQMVKDAYWLLPAARFGQECNSMLDRPGHVTPRGPHAN
jgi:hypothetical protein